MINVANVSMCPLMDVVAIVTRDGTLIVSRTTSWQRLITQSKEALMGAISAMCWSPDGHRLAVGHCYGALSIFDIEVRGSVTNGDLSRMNGNNFWAKNFQHRHRICLMWWAKQVCTKHKPSERNIHDLARAKFAASDSVQIEVKFNLSPLQICPAHLGWLPGSRSAFYGTS